MGILGLHNFLKDKEVKFSAINPGHISHFRGKRAAVDVYSWLHKSIFTCALELFMNRPTTKYIDYCMKFIKLLKSYEITPVLVFDGDRMPFKVVEGKRREERLKAKQRAKDLMAIGNTNAAHKSMALAIDITHEMAVNVIKAARDIGIDCVVAPYEADPQLAYLEINNNVDFVITEDSDLIVFGCTNIFFKLSIDGSGEIYSKSKLGLCLQKKGFKETLDFEKFRHAAILSGCDYLKSLPGIGLVKACKFMTMTEIRDIPVFLKKLPIYLNLPVIVDDTYIKSFIMADMSFKHAIVFDPVSKTQLPLTEIEETTDDYIQFIGSFKKHDVNDLELALGNVDSNNKQYDNFKIDNFSRSIYSQASQLPGNMESKNIKCGSYKFGNFGQGIYTPPSPETPIELTLGKVDTKNVLYDHFKIDHSAQSISYKPSEDPIRNSRQSKRKMNESSSETQTSATEGNIEMLKLYSSFSNPTSKPPVKKPEEVKKVLRSCKFSVNKPQGQESSFFLKDQQQTSPDMNGTLEINEFENGIVFPSEMLNVEIVEDESQDYPLGNTSTQNKENFGIASTSPGESSSTARLSDASTRMNQLPKKRKFDRQSSQSGQNKPKPKNKLQKKQTTLDVFVIRKNKPQDN